MNATITSRNHEREGRGFSKSEIKEAGCTIHQLRALNMPIDVLRKSTYKANVDILKKVEKPKVKKAVKKAEPKKE